MSALVDSTPELDVSRLLTVLRAVRKGDFSVRLPDVWTGVAGKVADTLNEVIELNEHLAAELERLSTLVGQRGRLQERANVGAVTGAWADSVSNINSLIASLGQPTSEAARVIGAVAKGDLSQRIALEIDGRPLEGEFLRTARSVNRMVDQLSSFASEVTRVAREVGTEGKLGGQARVKGVAGTWKDLTDSVNSMAGNLTAQVRNIAEVTTAVANGDLSQKDHRRRPRRGAGAEGHHQHDGGSAPLVRLRGDPGGARGRDRGQAGRPGAGGGRVRHLARPHRQR